MIDDELRERLHRGLPRIVRPAPHLGPVVRRAGRLRARRRMASAAVAALLVAGIALPLASLAGLGHGEMGVGGPVEGYGLTLGLPDGWDGLIRYGPGDLGPVVEAGSIALPTPAPQSDFRAAASEAVPPDGVVLALHEFVGFCPCPGFEQASPPISIRAGDFIRWQGIPDTQAWGERLFHMGDRYFSLWVLFGSNPAPEAQLEEVNGVLSALSIDPAFAPPASGPSANSWPAPTFDPASGWQTVADWPARSSINAPASWASSVPFAPEDLALAARVDALPFPSDTLRSLPPDGIAIVASLPLPDQTPAPPKNPNFPDRTLPLTVADSRGCGEWEGEVSPNVPECLILGRVDQQYVDVRVYFGQPNPDERLRAQADEELARLRFPAAGPSPSAPAPLDHGTAQMDGADGIALLTPAGWSFAEDPSGPAEPKTEVAISNVPIPKGGECAPTAAIDALPPDGVLAWVIEYQLDVQPGDFPARPDRFSLDPNTLAPYECSGVPSYMFRFSDQGRYFQVHLVLGPQASDADRDLLLASLSSMIVDRCPPGHVPRRLGQAGTVEPTSGPQGTVVTVSGDTYRTEDWFWAPSDRIELWWNDPVLANIGPTQDATHFPLASIDPGTDCTFSVTFKVPDVPAGPYTISARVYARDGFGWLLERRFDVTP